MKYAFIPAKAKDIIVLPKELIDSLPAEIALFTTIQFKESINSMRKQIEESGKTVHLIRPPHSVSEGLVLGCGIKEFDSEIDSFLFVGDGAFHPLTLIVRNNQKVICWDPFTNKKSELTIKDIEYVRKKEKAGYVKFLSSDKIGVLLSMKPGQNRRRLSESLEKHFPEKKFYYFLCDQLDFTQLENFPFIEMWINTACPRIMVDDVRKFTKPIINIEHLLELYLPKGTKIPPR